MLKKFTSIILFFLLSIRLFGQDISVPIKKCWEIKDKGVSTNLVASDNVTGLIIFTNEGGGLLKKIDVDGNISWAFESEGEIISNLVISNGHLVFAVKFPENNLIGIKCLSLDTGIVVWQKVLNLVEYNETDSFHFFHFQDNLIFVPDQRTIYSISNISGEFRKIREFGKKIVSNLVSNSNFLFYINDKLEIVSFDVINNKEVILGKLNKNQESQLLFYSKNNELLVLTKLNQILSFKLENFSWESRIGGSTISVSETDKTFLVSSVDNYLYAISKNNGSFVWRKRTDGRTDGILFRNLLYISSTINGQVTLVSELDKGKTVNRIVLSENEFFIRKPIDLGDKVVLFTNERVISYSFSYCK